MLALNFTLYDSSYSALGTEKTYYVIGLCRIVRQSRKINGLRLFYIKVSQQFTLTRL